MSVATSAFWLLILYIVLVLGLRVVIALRLTGRTGVVRAATPVELVGNLVLLAGVILGALNLLLGSLGTIDPWTALDRAFVHGLGFALCAAGIAGVFVSQMVMGPSWRIGIDTKHPPDLVTRSVFRYVRNPGYDSMIVAAIGFSVLVPTWLAVAGLALMIAGFLIQVRLIEEPYLLRLHGQVYASYARRVGRFLPGLGRLHEQRAGQFDAASGAR